MVHCENEDAIRYLIGRHEDRGDVAPRAHASNRPVGVEREATHRALSLAEIVDVPVVIVHVSNGAAMGEIRAARMRGPNVIGEACPQYLTLTAADLDGMDWEGAKFVCSPAARRGRTGGALARARDRRFRSLLLPPLPVPVRRRARQAESEGARQLPAHPERHSGSRDAPADPLLRRRDEGTHRPAPLRGADGHEPYEGLRPGAKGRIAVGMDADIAIWDPQVHRTIRHADLHDGADYSPYEGMEVHDWPTTVVLRGRVAIRDGQLVGAAGQGAFQARSTARL